MTTLEIGTHKLHSEATNGTEKIMSKIENQLRKMKKNHTQ